MLGLFLPFSISLSQIITLEMLGFFYVADNKFSTRKLGGNYTSAAVFTVTSRGFLHSFEQDAVTERRQRIITVRREI